MIELLVIGILGVIEAVTIAGFYLYIKEAGKEREKMINAIMAKNAVELRDLEMTQKIAPIEMPKPDNNFIPVSDLDDSEFDAKILGLDE